MDLCDASCIGVNIANDDKEFIKTAIYKDMNF
jgi:hypothetical protein